VGQLVVRYTPCKLPHGFHNLLQVILGCGDLALGEAKKGSTQEKSLEAVMNASRRAAKLVRQLLAYSCRQVLEMKNVDLNGVINDMMNILRRVIGENIELEFRAGDNTGIVHVDPNQVNQIIANLCVNARDAIGTSGSITIETADVHIDKTYCQTHPWDRTGRYVLISVTDTGCGIDQENLDRIFDPFYTTKETGKGTGLGLSTVYGLVKKHEGLVHVYSEPGKGTVFKVYFPVVEEEADKIDDRPEIPVKGGIETILLAEDEKMVRDLTGKILEQKGYTVLTARDGEEAVAVFEENAEHVDMLILDVVMPMQGGKEVYEQIRKTRPEIGVLFLSGYNMNAVHTNFVLDEGLDLMQKPCNSDQLLRKVREILDK